MEYCDRFKTDLIEWFGGSAEIPEVPDSQVEDTKQLEGSDNAEEGSKEESHPADGLTEVNMIDKFDFFDPLPVDNVQHVLGDVELYGGDGRNTLKACQLGSDKQERQ